MYSNEVKGAPQNPDLLLRSYMVGRVLLRPSPPTIQHIYTYQIKKSVQPTGYDAFVLTAIILFSITEYAGTKKLEKRRWYPVIVAHDSLPSFILISSESSDSMSDI